MFPTSLLKHISRTSLKKKKKNETLVLVWYVCLKTKNCCLKTFMKIRVGKKVC